MMSLILFSVSAGGILNSIVIPLFGPYVYTRYMEPVVFCAVFGLQLIIIAALGGSFTKECGEKQHKNMGKKI